MWGKTQSITPAQLMGEAPGLTKKEAQKAAQGDPKAMKKAAELIAVRSGQKAPSVLQDLRNGLAGGGSKGYQNIPLRDRMHPAAYARTPEGKAEAAAASRQQAAADAADAAYRLRLHREAKRQGLI